jgi:hypothetical protein
VSALAAAFAFRLAFGLSYDFWFEDQTQIFLIGLRHHATGAWPYFGPDVVWTRSQIPGALQGLLVGLPMDLVPVPEAPFVLLNVLSMAALCLLCAYVCRRLPSLPAWLVFGWALTVPWTLNYSTHVVNPSYVLPGSVLFFIGFLETFPATSAALVRLPLAAALMGFGVCWVMQVHLSWVLLVPFAVLALGARAREGLRPFAVAVGAAAAGALVSGSLLLPTLWQFGADAGTGGVQRNLRPHLVGPWVLVTTAGRFLSFASLEVNRFLEITRSKRLFLLHAHPWLVPLVAITGLAGIVHPTAMAALWFRRRSAPPEWMAIRWLAVGTVVLIYLSYFFAYEPPQAHAFYVVAPLALVYAFYSWSLIDTPRWRRVAAAVLATSVAYHVGLAAVKSGRSLYHDRRVPALAVLRRAPAVLGRRREYSMDARLDAAAGREPDVPGEARTDLQAASSWSRPWGIALWTVTVRNLATAAAYRDLRYQCHYRAADGRVVRQSGGLLEEILQPGTERTVQVVDGLTTAEAVSAELRILGAEKLLPLSAALAAAPRASAAP